MQAMQVLSTQTITQIIHIADIHIRIGNYEVARVAEYKAVFDAFIEEISAMDAVKNSTALLVICGDIFHSKCRMESAGTQAFFDWINKLLELLPIIIICGNHDYKQSEPDVTDSVEMLCTPYKKYGRHKYGIHYLSQTGQYIWGNIGFGVVSVKDTLREFNTAGIVADLPTFPSPDLFDNNNININNNNAYTHTLDLKVALFHGTISQSALPSGKTAESVSSGYPLMWFAGYDAVMLGDNHKQQLHTHESGLAWGYPGSLVQQDFGETLYGHGYILWDVSTKRGKLHHIHNNYGAISVVDTSIYTAPQTKYTFKEAIELEYFPKYPRVRIIGDRDDISICEALFKKHTIVPCEIIVRSKIALMNRNSNHNNHSNRNSTNEAILTPEEDCKTENNLEDDISKLTSLNSYTCWESYLKTAYVNQTEVEVISEWLHNPKNMMIPLNYTIHTSLLESIKVRNTKMEKLFDTYQKFTHGHVSQNYNISFKHMQWDYLMCYGEGNYFDFTKITDKIALINGANATGKSAFLDVLCIAIYGEPTLQRRDYSGSVMSCKIINDHKPHGTVSGVLLCVEIIDESSTISPKSIYEIHRTFINHSVDEQSDSVKPSIIAVYKICEETQTKTIVAEGASMVNVWIHKYFGTIDEMLMSSILCQSDTVNFFTHKPVDQKLIIEKALHMDSISTFVEYLEECVKGHKYILEKIHSYREGLQQSVVDTNAQETCTIDETSLSIMEQQLAEYNDEVRSLSTHNNELLSIIGNIGMATQASIENTDTDEALRKSIDIYEIECKNVRNSLQSESGIIELREKLIRLQVQHESIIGQFDKLGMKYELDMNYDIIESQLENELRNAETKKNAHMLSHKPQYSLEYIEEKSQQYYNWLDTNNYYININTCGLIQDYSEKNSILVQLLETYKKYEGMLTAPVKEVFIENTDIYDINNIDALYNTYKTEVEELHEYALQKPVYNEKVPIECISNTIDMYNTWRIQFPDAWFTTHVDELKNKLEVLRNEYNVLMYERHIRKPCVEKPPVGLQTSHAIYTIDMLEKLQTPIHIEKDISKYNAWENKWNTWCIFVKTVPQETVQEITDRMKTISDWLHTFNDSYTKLVNLQKNYSSNNEEIAAINAMEFNPECWACCKQPKMIRLEVLKTSSKDIQKRIVKYEKYVEKHKATVPGLEKENKELEAKLKIRQQYDEKYETYTSENDIWLRALDASKRESKRKIKLANVWWYMWESWNTQVTTTKDEIMRLETYLHTYIDQNALYEIAIQNQRVAKSFTLWSKTYDTKQRIVDEAHSYIWSIIKDSIRNINENISENNAHIINIKKYNDEVETWNTLIQVFKIDKEFHLTQNTYSISIKDLHESITKIHVYKSFVDISSEIENIQKQIDIVNTYEELEDNIIIFKRILAIREWEKHTHRLEELQLQISTLTQRLITNRNIYTLTQTRELNSKHINASYNDMKTRHERLSEFYTKFVGTKTVDGFKNWVYKNMVIPLIMREMNAFIINIDTFSINICMKSGKLIFMLHDRGSTPTLDHASGYQKYIAGLAMRVALLRIGAVGKNVKHLILDEGFVACDSTNILKTKEIMELLMKIGEYNSIMMISHLENIRDIADIRIDVSRCAKNITSYIRFGAMRKQIRKNNENNNDTVKTKDNQVKKKPGRTRKI